MKLFDWIKNIFKKKQKIDEHQEQHQEEQKQEEKQYKFLGDEFADKYDY